MISGMSKATQKERDRRYRESQEAKGMVRRTYWIPRDDEGFFRALVDACCQRWRPAAKEIAITTEAERAMGVCDAP